MCVFVFVVAASDMTPYYETLAGDKVVELDQSLLDSMRAKNEDEIKKLDEKWGFLFFYLNFVTLFGCWSIN